MIHADTFINGYGELSFGYDDYELDVPDMPAITEAKEESVFNDITRLPYALDFVNTDDSVISWYGEEYTVRPEFAQLCSDFMWHQTKAHWVPCREEVEFYAIPF